MNNEHINFGKRFSGLEWATETREILLIGAGGIGSWTALSLSRVGHSLVIIDGDVVDKTNVGGGQLYRTKDVGKSKVGAVTEICREFGCTNEIMPIEEMYRETLGMHDVCITGLDNMATRKQLFKAWAKHLNSMVGGEGYDSREFLFMDGRMNAELFELYTVRGDREDQLEEYEKSLFDDEDVKEADCTQKQTTFMAMQAGGIITATLCNWLTNRKIGEEFRECPFYQRIYIPALMYTKRETQLIIENI